MRVWMEIDVMLHMHVNLPVPLYSVPVSSLYFANQGTLETIASW